MDTNANAARAPGHRMTPGTCNAGDEAAAATQADATMCVAYYERIRNRRAGHPADAWFGSIADMREPAGASDRNEGGCWVRLRRVVARFF
jgi:hypothetical protein